MGHRHVPRPRAAARCGAGPLEKGARYPAAQDTRYRGVLVSLSVPEKNHRHTEAFRLTGRKVTDLVNTIAISSLGYTPQFFSGYFSGFSVVIELLVKSGGKAIIIDKSFQPQVSEYGTVPVPSFDALEDTELLTAISTSEGPDALRFAVDSEAAVGLDDYAALFHSSGTTGGMPKIIPNTYKMIRAVILYKHSGAQDPDKEFLANGGGQTVANTLGSLAHIASFHSTYFPLLIRSPLTKT